MIEISKGDISDLTLIRELLADSPLKFIIYIDDLSFDSREDSFGELKAALEGSLSGKSTTLLFMRHRIAVTLLKKISQTVRTILTETTLCRSSSAYPTVSVFQ